MISWPLESERQTILSDSGTFLTTLTATSCTSTRTHSTCASRLRACTLVRDFNMLISGTQILHRRSKDDTSPLMSTSPFSTTKERLLACLSEVSWCLRSIHSIFISYQDRFAKFTTRKYAFPAFAVIALKLTRLSQGPKSHVVGCFV